MLLTLISSKRDVYGNCYHAVQLSDHGKVLAQGTAYAPNANTYEVRESLKWETATKELSIREFSRLTKEWPYFGSSWNDIKANLLKE